ncbi:2-amino-4-hydroxy-6-hydroxymethyldihydropteridine diphosphokinase [Demequina sp. NBRC 110055]|uniref:2-amino-4-hydroxy-6- hydroxymethyldihydropteridine diphosphokinase n=1 Tax=Demequina sp. NBRC 110055 TaxID=1570344 RepID=UPI000A00FC0F|nr:2-amino-4-hydroxy-6-hydroxymethyldihydropteridine diphosphokinase [Demequina sp. NBRC 110055]
MTVHTRPYVKDGIELDQIAVEGIRLEGFHGVFQAERESGQLFFADVVAHTNTRAAGARDDLTRSVNYSEIADRVADVLGGEPVKLIEAVAERIAKAVLGIPLVECVDVTVHKPQAPLHVEFKDVTVTIRRDQREGSLWADKRIGSSAGESDDPTEAPEVSGLGTGGTGGAGGAGVSGAPGVVGGGDQMDARPAQPTGALIALGGNLGDVEQTFRAALSDLHRIPGVQVVTVSPLVRSVPEGGLEQPDYLNGVVRVQTALSPRELLNALLGIELAHGRERSVPNAARTLDLDLIQYEGVTGVAADLELPHPRAYLRRFVLEPWAAIEPDARLLPHGAVVDLLRQAGFDALTRVGAGWDAVADAPVAAPAGVSPR